MKSFVLAAVAIVALTLSFVGLVRAEDKDVKESDVPKPALDAVKKKYPAATFNGFEKEEEDGKVQYEIKMSLKEKTKDGAEKVRALEVIVSPEGKILAEEEVVDAKDLPAAVTKALAGSKYAGWDVKKAERIVKNEDDANPCYEVIVVKGDAKFEVVFDKTGKITEEEDKSKGKKDEKD